MALFVNFKGSQIEKCCEFVITSDRHLHHVALMKSKMLLWNFILFRPSGDFEASQSPRREMRQTCDQQHED